jgi:hypothetical protein
MMISLSDRVTISKDVIFQELSGEAVLLDLARETYFGLDQVGTMIWQSLDAGGVLQSAHAAILSQYDVEAARLERDILEFVGRLAEAGLVVVETVNAEPQALP